MVSVWTTVRSSCQLVRVSVVVSIIVCYNYTVLELKMLVMHHMTAIIIIIIIL